MKFDIFMLIMIILYISSMVYYWILCKSDNIKAIRFASFFLTIWYFVLGLGVSYYINAPMYLWIMLGISMPILALWRLYFHHGGKLWDVLGISGDNKLTNRLFYCGIAFSFLSIAALFRYIFYSIR